MKLKENNGITIIALIVTIVVMLTLVGVTVNQFVSDEGLFHSITGIHQETKKEIANTTDGMSAGTIESKLDNGVGAEEHQTLTGVDFDLVDYWTNDATVELKLNDYELITGGKNYAIEDIYYSIRPESGGYSDYQKGNISKYQCCFKNLTPATNYIIGVFGQYKDNNGKLSLAMIDDISFQTRALTYEKGDWVDYDAGVWTQAEITALGNLYYDSDGITAYEDNMVKFFSQLDDGVALQHKFSGMKDGRSKNLSQSHSKTGFSGYYGKWSAGPSSSTYTNNINEQLVQGWRILGVNDKEQLILVSAGIPEYFLDRCQYSAINKIGKEEYAYRHYPDKPALEAINQRNFSEYVNEEYAESARMMTYEDVKSAETVSDLAKIGATYMQATVEDTENGTKRYSIQDALNKGIYGSNHDSSRITFYHTDSTRKIQYSAGLLGVRVVVILHSNWTPINTDASGNAVTGKSYTSPLHLVDKSTIR